MSEDITAEETKSAGIVHAIEAFDRAIAADPGFALAHTARAHALLERGDAAAARASMAAANSLTTGLSARRWGGAGGAYTADRRTRAQRPLSSGPLVPAVSRAFAAFERRDFSTTIEALEPIVGELERIGGSRAQLDLVEFTLLRAYVGADRLEDAHRMLSMRHRGSRRIAVAELGAVH